MQKIKYYDKIKQVSNNLFKGFVVGASFAVPGFCSAILAMFLNVYDKLLEVIGAIFNVRILLKNLDFIIGIASGLIFVIIGISYIIDKEESSLKLIFLGLMISGLINLKKKIDFKNIGENLYIMLGIFISILPEILPQTSTKNSIFLIVMAGLISAIGFILPGVSGSLMLLTIGVYPVIIKSISSTIKIFIKMPNRTDLIITSIFLMSFVLGMLLFVKLIKIIIKKKEKVFLKFCLGLIIGTVLIMLYDCYYVQMNIIKKISLIFIGFLIMSIFKEKEC